MSRGICSFCEEEINESPHCRERNGKKELYHNSCILLLNIIEEYPERVKKALETRKEKNE